MFPAARIGDPITHDMLVPSGAIGIPAGPPTTLIEGLPAAHVGCQCACAGTISAPPGTVHIPPPPAPVPIVKGSATVLINGMPAARWAPAPDMTACGAFLGMTSLAASRTVLIGG